MRPRQSKPEPSSPQASRRADFGTFLLTPRDRLGLRFVGEQKYVRYDALGQLFAPEYAPATNVLPLGLRRPPHHTTPEHDPPPPSSNGTTPQRGGNRAALPWPTDYRKRIHAVGSVVQRWQEKMGYAKLWRPALDQPKWVTLTAAGLQRMGLPYEEVDWPEQDEHLAHYHHVTMVRLSLARRRSEYIPAHTWICERAMEAEHPFKEAGMDLPTRPDGILHVEHNGTMQLATGRIVPITYGEHIAIEVELSRKTFEKYGLEVFPSHLEHFTAIWYFCAPDAYNAVVAARRDRLQTDAQRERILIRQLEYDERKVL